MTPCGTNSKLCISFHSSYGPEIRKKILVFGLFVAQYSYLTQVTTPIINPSLPFYGMAPYSKIHVYMWLLLCGHYENAVFGPFFAPYSYNFQNQPKSTVDDMASCNTVSKRFIHQ